MIILLVLVAVVTTQDLEPTETPRICFPPCPLPSIGVEICHNLVEFSGCIEGVDKWSESNDRLKQHCGCQWDHVLKKFSNLNGNQTTEKSKAFQDCHAYVQRLCKLTRLGLNYSDWLITMVQSMRKEKSRISELKSKHQRHAARTALIERIDQYMSNLLSNNNNSQGSTDVIQRKKTTTENPKTTATAGSATEAPSHSNYTSVKKHIEKLHPMKNDDKMKVLFFSCVVMTILFIFICALLGKLKYDSSGVGFSRTLVGDLHIDEEQLKKEKKKNKCWETFLDKLRLRYRQKAEENEKRDLHPMSELNPITGSKTSNHSIVEKSSVHSDVGVKKSVSNFRDEDEKSTLIRLYGSRSSDSNNDEEYRIFHTRMTKDYGSATNKE